MQRRRKVIIALGLIVQVLFIKLLSHFPEFVEQFYSNGVYKIIAKGMHYALGWIPFSFGDLFYTIGGILALRWLWINRRRIIKDTKNWSLDVLATISILYFAFHVLWAYNYYRLPLHKALDVGSDYSTETLVDVTENLIEKVNALHAQLSPIDSVKIDFPQTENELLNMVPQGYDLLSKEFTNFAYPMKSLKKSIYSLPLTYMGFSGYLNPFTNEAQIDGLIPKFKYPSTASHEVAHQLGYAAENEANFIGSMACIYHEDTYFNYSGYAFILRHCMREIYKRDSETHEHLASKIYLGVKKNYKEVSDFWMNYQNPLEPLFKTTYNGFLKANNQSAGIQSYSYVVALYVNYFEKYPI